MKRILCLLICLVMALGLLPAAAGAATDIDEVSITGLDHPVIGLELDFSYKIPSRGIQYEIDNDFDDVIWYDLGTNDNDTKTALKEGAKAEKDHSYVAELHLITTKKYSFRTRGVEVELSEEMASRVVEIQTEVFDSNGTDNALTISLYYQADYLYDRKNPVKLTLDEEFDGTVKAGDYPWSAADFSGVTRSHYDLSVTWYVGKQDVERNQMDQDDRFEAGQTYTLKVELDASRSTRHATFDSDTDILINGEKGDTWVGNDLSLSAYALFQFTASEGIEKVSIKGIETPEIGGNRQRSGFTCSTDSVDVEYNRWEVVTSSGDTEEFRREFESGKEYLLYLDLIPDSGFSLSNLKKSSISVNKGTVADVFYEDDTWTVVISFETGEMSLSSIEVTSLPKKTEYYIGESFQPRGMVVTAVYSDGHTEKLSAEDYDYTPDGSLDKEDTVITIRYKEGKITKETELNITVIDEDLTLTGIVITAKPKKTSYVSGEIFDPKGMVVTAVYDDKSTSEVTNLEFIPDDELTVNDDEVVVRYTEGRKSVTAEVKIKVTKAEKILTALELTEEPTKTTYYEGEYFDPTGMVLTAIYEDKSTAVVTDFTYKPRTALKLTDETVLIVYNEKNIAQTVEVRIQVEEYTRTLTGLEITTPPKKTVYTEGELFEPEGMVITAVYDDKTSSVLSKYDIKPAGKLAVDSKNVTVSYTENGVTKTVKQPITVEAILVNPFHDVKESDYFYDAVLWAFYHDPQVTNGMSDTEFGPAVTCTRGQVVTFLWRAAGCPAPTAKNNPFKDVSDDAWYHDAVLWAVEKGITNGTSADSFSPGSTCSLAHVITFLYRAAGEPGKTAKPEKWYTDAMNWAFKAGLFKDLTFSEIKPGVECPRQDIVSFLYYQYNQKG